MSKFTVFVFGDNDIMPKGFKMPRDLASFLFSICMGMLMGGATIFCILLREFGPATKCGLWALALLCVAYHERPRRR